MNEQNFIADILAHPDDDTSRLVFADWLEEQGDPRSEFIRLQCEIAKNQKTQRWFGMYPRDYSILATGGRASQLQSLRSREIELLVAHAKRWVAPLGPKVTGVFFERGFVDGLSCELATFLDGADIWFRHVPLRQVHVRHFTRQHFYLWLESPLLLHIDTLDFNGAHLENHDVLTLTKSPNLANLRRLNLAFSLHDDEAAALLASPHLQGLRTLRRGQHASLDKKLRSALEARFGPP